MAGSHINLMLKKARGTETMAEFNQHFIIYCLSLQLQPGIRWIKGKTNFYIPWRWWKWLSSGSTKRRQRGTGAASHLCVCPAPITIYLLWLLTFCITQRRFPVELQKQRQNVSVSRETWAGKFAGLDSDAAPQARRPAAQWRPAPHPQKLPRPMWKSVPWGSLLNHWRIPHDDSEPFSKLAGRKLGFTSMVVWGGMCSFKGYFITTQLS